MLVASVLTCCCNVVQILNLNNVILRNFKCTQIWNFITTNRAYFSFKLPTKSEMGGQKIIEMLRNSKFDQLLVRYRVLSGRHWWTVRPCWLVTSRSWRRLLRWSR